MPTGTLLGSCTVLETAGEGALGPLLELLDSPFVGIEHPSIERTGNLQELKLDVNSFPTIQKKIVRVHFGVNSGATNFAIKWCAVNEATFQCADELGWQPQHAAIITEDGPISHIREIPCLHSLNGIESSVEQFFDFVKNVQFRFFETFQNLRSSVSGTCSESKEPPVTYQMSHSRQA